MIDEDEPTYEHDATCDPTKDLQQSTEDIQTCVSCLGMFDNKGVGLRIMDPRLV